MHISIDDYNTYVLLVLTTSYSTSFTTMSLLTIEHMVMFVVTYFVIKAMVKVMDLSITYHNFSANIPLMCQFICYLR